MKKIVKSMMPAIYLMFIAFSAASCNKTQAAPATGTPAQPVDLTYAAEKSLPAVVYIKSVTNSKVQTVEYSDPFEDFFSDPFGGFFGRGQGQGNNGGRKRQVQTPKRAAAGSGVIISSDGYIVTNNHVVDGADELTVTLNENSKEYSARIIGADKTTDLALIKIDAKNLPAIVIANSDDVKVGEWVLAVGNPLGLNNTVTAGIVSAKARQMSGENMANAVQSFIQTDAAINRGNSGGALVNANGELVGINAMLYSETGSYSGYGFAIPTTIMNKVVSDLKTYGTVQRALIGIQGQDLNVYTDGLKNQGKDVPDFGVINGIYVGKVVDDGAGAAAGLKEGDVITAIDGKPLKAMAELQEYLANKRPGDKVTLTYMRNKDKKTAHVTLKNAQGNTKVVKTADLDVLGANIREVNAEEKKQLEINYGLKVTKVGNGALRKARITDGFIILNANDEPMRTVADLQEAVKSASTSSDPVLYIKGIYSTGKKAYFVVELSDEE